MTIREWPSAASDLASETDAGDAARDQPAQAARRSPPPASPVRVREVGRSAPAEHAAPTLIDMRLLVEAIPHIVWTAASDGSIEFLNQWGVGYTGFSPETNYGWGWVWLVHPDDADRAHSDWERATRIEAALDAEYRIRRADGRFRWHRSRSLPVRGDDGQVVNWIGTAVDIDDVKRSVVELLAGNGVNKAALTLLEELQSKAPIGLGFVDRDFRIVRLNETLAAINGAPAAQQVGRMVADVMPEIWPQIEVLYRHVLESGTAVLDVEIEGRSAAAPAEVRHWLTSHYPLSVEGDLIGIGIVVVDITERKQSEEFRSVVMDNMAEGLYTVDGDGLLTYMNRAAAKMLDRTKPELLGQPMHEAIHFQRADGTPLPSVECSLLSVRTGGQAVRMADEAFTRKDGTIFPVAYSAAPLKIGSSGDGAVVVFRDVTEEKEDQRRIERELSALSWVGRIRDAIDEHRMVLYSQPVVPLAGGPHGEELLMRMVGRSGEIVLPGSFLPVAEKYGLIGEIDRWVTIEAIRMAATGRRIEANLSATSIGTLDMLPFIARQLRETGADPANLVFEITETTLMRDIDAGEAFARGLAELGCELALDDFGTGFGSFTYLKKLPLNYLKIDIEFIRDVAITPANLHVVRAVVGLAQAFGLQTIAEGVQDEQTMSILRSEGVDFAQGFHLGRPGPIQYPQVDARGDAHRRSGPERDAASTPERAAAGRQPLRLSGPGSSSGRRPHDGTIASAGDEHVAPLERDVGSEAYQQLHTVFLEHLPRQLVELRNAALVGDVPAARYVAHQLKGTALSFGAVQLNDLVGRLLQVGRDQSDLLRLAVEDVDQEIARLVRAGSPAPPDPGSRLAENEGKDSVDE